MSSPSSNGPAPSVRSPRASCVKRFSVKTRRCSDTSRKWTDRPRRARCGFATSPPGTGLRESTWKTCTCARSFVGADWRARCWRHSPGNASTAATADCRGPCWTGTSTRSRFMTRSGAANRMTGSLTGCRGRRSPNSPSPERRPPRASVLRVLLRLLLLRVALSRLLVLRVLLRRLRLRVLLALRVLLRRLLLLRVLRGLLVLRVLLRRLLLLRILLRLRCFRRHRRGRHHLLPLRSDGVPRAAHTLTLDVAGVGVA